MIYLCMFAHELYLCGTAACMITSSRCFPSCLTFIKSLASMNHYLPFYLCTIFAVPSVSPHPLRVPFCIL